MRKFLIASHGRIASGIRSSVRILTGDDSAIEAIDAYVDDSDYTPRLERFVAAAQPGDERVIFTDLYGGSVFQKAVLARPEARGVMHVTGVNLAAVLGCLLSPDPLTPQAVDAILADAASQVKRVEPLGSAEAGADGGEGEEGFFD